MIKNKSTEMDAAAIQAALADHEILMEYLENVNKLFAAGSPADVRDAIEATREVISKKLVVHFACEEHRIFPALLRANSSDQASQLVFTLRREHRQLLKDARELNKMLMHHDIVASCSGPLREAVMGFFHKLEKHSAKENELFPSLL